MKTAIRRTVAAALTSDWLRDARRSLARRRRRRSGARPEIDYFHQPDDPYSHLLLQLLPELASRYEVRVATHLVPPPPDSAAPDRARLLAWSRRDAAELAGALGLLFADPGQAPTGSLVAAAGRALAAALAGSRELDVAAADALTASRALWSGDAATLERAPRASEVQTHALMAAGEALRARLGHYLGGMLHFEGEWYWGVDRLEHLEDRLRAEGLARHRAEQPIVHIPRVECLRRPTNGHRPTLHFFCSLRSPYTYLAVDRVQRLARHYDARLELRYVLPMVMRGLPVPREKRLYILRDAKREADALGLPFGRIVDPVGRPTERGLAVLHQAVRAGKGPAFLESFMRGVWAEGIDAGSDRGLRRIAARADLDDTFVAAALADPSWREAAAANRDEMLALGLWGVPSFRVDANPARWGQDRLWLVEQDLVATTRAGAADEQHS